MNQGRSTHVPADIDMHESSRAEQRHEVLQLKKA
jgi:hypothetical protein